jgi:hypothetical protein
MKSLIFTVVLLALSPAASSLRSHALTDDGQPAGRRMTCANAKCLGICRNTPEGPPCTPNKDNGQQPRSNLASCAGAKCLGSCIEIQDGILCINDTNSQEPNAKGTMCGNKICEGSCSHTPDGDRCVPKSKYGRPTEKCANQDCHGSCFSTSKGLFCIANDHDIELVANPRPCGKIICQGVCLTFTGKRWCAYSGNSEGPKMAVRRFM